jgi:hypothetical protein
MRDSELLAAYVDGVSELSPAERKRVDELLANEPQLRRAERETRALVGELRELAPVGGEPDWVALERGIGDAVRALPARTWWQRWRWRVIVPGVGLAMTAAIVAFVMRPAIEVPAPPSPPIVEAPVEHDEHDELRAALPLWLDGTDLDVAFEAAALFDLAWELDEDSLPETAELLPPSDLEWLDDLDAAALERAEQYLDHPRNQRGPT